MTVALLDSRNIGVKQTSDSSLSEVCVLPHAKLGEIEQDASTPVQDSEYHALRNPLLEVPILKSITQFGRPHSLAPHTVEFYLSDVATIPRNAVAVGPQVQPVPVILLAREQVTAPHLITQQYIRFPEARVPDQTSQFLFRYFPLFLAKVIFLERIHPHAPAQAVTDQVCERCAWFSEVGLVRLPENTRPIHAPLAHRSEQFVLRRVHHPAPDLQCIDRRVAANPCLKARRLERAVRPQVQFPFDKEETLPGSGFVVYVHRQLVDHIIRIFVREYEHGDQPVPRQTYEVDALRNIPLLLLFPHVVRPKLPVQQHEAGGVQ